MSLYVVSKRHLLITLNTLYPPPHDAYVLPQHLGYFPCRDLLRLYFIYVLTFCLSLLECKLPESKGVYLSPRFNPRT